MEHWITAKRDELISSDVQDAVTPSSPAQPSALPTAHASPGTLAEEHPDSMLCSRDSEDEDAESTCDASEMTLAMGLTPKTPVGVAGVQNTSSVANSVDGTEYFI